MNNIKTKYLVLLWVVSVLSTAAGIPYIFALQESVLAEAPLPLPALGALMVVQTALLLALSIFIGSRLAKRIGLPVSAFPGQSFAQLAKSIFRLAVPLGVLAGVAIYALDVVLASFTSGFAVDAGNPALWKTLLASFYGGVVEEVLMRLLFVSLFAWLLAKLFGVNNPKDNRAVMWTAIVLAAVLFGLGHLPATSALTEITPLIVFRAIVLNGIGGLIFGWLYWKRGLEYSIAAHFTTDIVLLAILPRLL